MISIKLKNYEPLFAEKHIVYECPDGPIRFADMLIEEGFKIGDDVQIENQDECKLPLLKDEYCLTFKKNGLFIEEPCTKRECKKIFGKEFDY